MKKSLLALAVFAVAAMSTAFAAGPPVVADNFPTAVKASTPAAAQKAEAVSTRECAALIRIHAQAPHVAPASTVARVCRGEPRYEQVKTVGIQTARPSGLGLRMPPSQPRPKRYLT